MNQPLALHLIRQEFALICFLFSQRLSYKLEHYLMLVYYANHKHEAYSIIAIWKYWIEVLINDSKWTWQIPESKY